MRVDLEEWRAIADPFYDVHPRVPRAQAGVDVHAVERNGLLLSQLFSPEQMLIHDPGSRPLVNHAYLLFERFESGSGLADVAGDGFSVRPSQLHVIDMSRRYVSLKQASRSRGVLIPHAMLDYDPSRDPAFVTLDLDSAPGRLLASAHELLAEGLSARDEASVPPEMAPAFVSLVERLMLKRDSPAARERREAALPLTLRNYIGANLADPALSPATLCAAFDLSRTTLYRYFEDEGGVARHIRNRRLDRCFSELAGAEPARGRVSAVARRWGFSDATAFNRLFRARFGVPPSACFAAPHAVAGAQTSLLIQTAQTWLRQL